MVDLLAAVFAELAKPPAPEIIVYRGVRTFTVAENVEGLHFAKFIFKNAYFPEVNDTRFEITPQGVLKLKDGQSLDFQALGEVRVTVTACGEDGHECDSETVVITVTEVNEAPTIEVFGGGDADSTAGGITASFTVAENSGDAVAGAAGAVLGLIKLSDPDAGQMHTFTVDDDRFQVIDHMGAKWLTLKSGVSLDFEEAGTVDLTLTVTDDGTPAASATAEVTITVTDVVETSPASIPNHKIERVEFYQGQVLDILPRPDGFEPLPAIIETKLVASSTTPNPPPIPTPRPTMMLVRANAPISENSISLEILDRGGAPIEWDGGAGVVSKPMWEGFAPSEKNRYGEREIAFDITDAVRPLTENADAPFPRFTYILTDARGNEVASGHLPDVKVLPQISISYVLMRFEDSVDLPHLGIKWDLINSLQKQQTPLAYKTLPIRFIEDPTSGVIGGGTSRYTESQTKDEDGTRKRPSELLYERLLTYNHYRTSGPREGGDYVTYYVGLYPGDTKHINTSNPQGDLTCGEAIQITDPQSGNINSLPRIIALLYNPEKYGKNCDGSLAHELGHALSLAHPWEYAAGDYPFAPTRGFTLPPNHGHYDDLELTRFRGYLILWEGGPHDAENKTPVFAGISRADGGFGAFGTRAGVAVPRV